MKKYFVLLTSVAVLLIGCSNPSGPNSESSTTVTILSGQIAGWTNGNGRNIALVYRDSLGQQGISSSATIDSKGFVSLQNLTSPPLSSLGSLIYPSLQGMKVLENTFSCTDSSALRIWCQLEVGNGTSPPWTGTVWRESYALNQIPKDGDFDVSYFYITKDVKLDGTVAVRSYAGTDTTEIEEIVHYNLDFKKGWNQQVRLYSSQRVFKDSITTVYSNEYSVTNNEPYKGKWIYYGN